MNAVIGVGDVKGEPARRRGANRRSSKASESGPPETATSATP